MLYDKTVLIVDDVAENIHVLSSILENSYEVIFAKSGRETLEIVNNGRPPDLILLDVMMPEMDGFEVCRRLKSSFSTRDIPIIFVTARDDEIDETRGFTLGAVDYITKPVKPPVVLSRIKNHLALSDQKRHLEDLVSERTEELEDTRLKIIRKLGKAGELKDNETGMHVIRVSKYAQLMGKELGMSDKEARLLLNVVPMHDIGKIGIPDSILLKEGKLDPKEWEIMKSHSLIGADIIGEDESEILREAAVCALTHHEKWDGSGYPRGLKGEEIPLYGRITALADVFDALTSERSYKNAWPVEEALNMIREQRGRQFDPQLVDIFFKVLPDILKVKEHFKD